MKYQFQQHDAEQMNHNAFQRRKSSGVQPWNQTNKISDQHQNKHLIQL